MTYHRAIIVYLNDAEMDQFMCNRLFTRPPTFYRDKIDKLPIGWENCVSATENDVRKLFRHQQTTDVKNSDLPSFFAGTDSTVAIVHIRTFSP